jgi:predicted amidohydrolase
VNRRELFRNVAAAGISTRCLAAGSKGGARKITVALVQFDTVPEQIDRNIQELERLTGEAVRLGARWVMFHENSLCDYTPRVNELSQPVPDGYSVRCLEKLGRRLNCYVSFGLSEADHGRYYITQVFVGPEGFVHRYRKTWVWHDKSDKGYRDEWVRFDPGNGPDLFTIDSVKATCFICADGDARRCIDRATELKPEIVFFPNNRGSLPDHEYFGSRASTIGAPMLVTNRVGKSWMHPCQGGCGFYSADGAVLAKANRDGNEQILVYTLTL